MFVSSFQGSLVLDLIMIERSQKRSCYLGDVRF